MLLKKNKCLKSIFESILFYIYCKAIGDHLRSSLGFTSGPGIGEQGSLAGLHVLRSSSQLLTNWANSCFYFPLISEKAVILILLRNLAVY